ncbi:MAG TPA: ATP-binding cassette domain-containing protein [Oligoflexia bacterium]|nr:ATP-binding cassette domain-containing protein [Oligoflexia bacterium]HMR24631.1 ATP-binding cassette domain-containing protein [Oligoflexia bacterium]
MLELQDISVSFNHIQILNNINLSVQAGRLVSLIGPSGCGKTTLLKTINALVPIQSGSITVDGKTNWQLSQLRKFVAYVIQQESLFPHLPVWKNIALPGKIQNNLDLVTDEKIKSILEDLHLDPNDVWNKLPAQLSGGQKQRVALARALIMQPKVLLLDEPFSALDPVTKRSLQETLKDLHKKHSTTIVMVTHDIHEAFMLSEYIFFLSEGSIIQQGSPRSFIEETDNPLVQSFIESQRYEY